MDNLFLIWVVATLPSFGIAMVILGIASAACGLFTFLASFEARVSESRERMAKASKFLFPFAASVFALGFLVPSQDNIIKAYLMVEGSKIITADNAENATGEIVERVDILMNAFFPDENPSAEEPKPAKTVTESDSDMRKVKAILRVLAEEEEKKVDQ